MIEEFTLFCADNNAPDALAWLVVQFNLPDLTLIGRDEHMQWLMNWTYQLPVEIGIQFGDRNLGYVNFLNLFRGLVANPTIRSLRMNRALYKPHTRELLNAIEGNPSLASLVLGVTAHNAEAVADFILKNQTPESIGLRDGGSLEGDALAMFRLDDAGRQCIANALEQNSCIASVILEKWTSAEVILEKTTRFRNLSLHECTFNPESLCGALKRNKTLESLTISGTRLDMPFLNGLIGVVQENQTLTKIDLTNSFDHIAEPGLRAQVGHALLTIDNQLQRNSEFKAQVTAQAM
jgi:hypothetical protein